MNSDNAAPGSEDANIPNGLLKLGAVNQAAIARSSGSAVGASGAPGGKLDDACARAGLDKIKDRLQ